MSGYAGAAILLSAFAIFLVLSGCIAPPELNPFPSKCYDGTKVNNCSGSKPYFCKANGQLAEDPEKCGCPPGYNLYGPVCMQVQKCEDGTEWDKCSADKPFICLGGKMIALATKCGCPEGLDAVGDRCEKIERCPDGTPYGSCAARQPGFCADGILLNKSSACGCEPGKVRAAWYGLNPENCISPRDVREYFDNYDRIVTTPDESQSAIDYVNQLRAKNRKKPIRFDMRAYYLSVARAMDMYNKEYLEHTSPTGICADTMKKEFGFGGNEYVAENAAGVTHAESAGEALGKDVNTNETRIFELWKYVPEEDDMAKVMAGWMNSPGHRANLLFDTHYAGGYACFGTACIFLGENLEGYGAGCYYAPSEKNVSYVPSTPYG